MRSYSLYPTMKHLVLVITLPALVVAMLAGCSPLTAENMEGRQPIVGVPVQLTAGQMKNAAYGGIYDEPVTLTDGVYEGEPFVQGGVARPVVTYIDHTLTYGDLDDDGSEDAVTLMMENSGGSGDFSYIGAQLNRGGHPVDVGAALLGDRVQLLSLRVEGGQVVAEIVTQAADEGLCCGTRKLCKRLALQEGVLVEVGSEELGTVRLDDLMGTQ
jgi:hypothetical protein